MPKRLPSNASSIDAEKLAVKDMTIDAENGSVLQVQAEKTLSVRLKNGSLVIYEGDPVIEKKVSNGSKLQQSYTD